VRARIDRTASVRSIWRVLGEFAYADVRTGPGCSPKVWLDVGKLTGGPPTIYRTVASEAEYKVTIGPPEDS
jgi:hypothetical protein